MVAPAFVSFWIVSIVYSPNAYYRDFIQPYLMAKAITGGTNPYLPLDELTRTYLPEAPPSIFRHRTPHTPTAGLLSVPLALFSYRGAAGAWLLFQFGLVVLIAYLFRRELAPKAPVLICGAFGALALFSAPLIAEIGAGQVNLLLLALLTFAWIALRNGKDMQSGAWIGAVLALKLFGWPLVLYLAWRRKWRAVGTTAATCALANLLACVVLGFGTIKEYYLSVGPQTLAQFRRADNNYSAHTLGRRPFEGIGCPIFNRPEVAPLYPSETLATIGGVLLPLAVLVVGLALARGVRDLDLAFGLLVCTSLLVSPIAWWHYLVLLGLPLAVLAANLRTANQRRGFLVVLIGVALAASRLLIPTSGVLAYLGSVVPALLIAATMALLWQARSVISRTLENRDGADALK